jgi:eukaryotic-like serine/threonine-protein kinase
MSDTEPDPPSESGDLLDDPRVWELVTEFQEELKLGRRPNRAAYVNRYPELAAAVGECLDGLQMLNAGLSSGGSPSRKPTQPPAPDVAASPQSAPLGDFQIIGEIARGGMGVVYEAMQLSLGRRVALKVLPFASTLDPRHLQRFKIEAQAAALLHHTHIVPIYAVGVDRGVHYYAMQLIEGQSLAAVLQELRVKEGRTPQRSPSSNIHDGSQTHDKQVGPVANIPSAALHSTADVSVAVTAGNALASEGYLRRTVRLMIQAAEALEHAHQSGVVHRDIKPANLLIDRSGNLWITDFGLAQLQNENGMTRSHDMLGTFRYMSPEQTGGQRAVLDHRTDIYSLGATFYELATLEPAFNAASHQELFYQILHAEPRRPSELNSALPVELDTIILKALSKNPAERYATAGEMAADLQRFLDHKPILARPPTLLDRLRKWSRRNPSVVVAALLLLLFGLVGFAISTVVIAREQRNTKEAYDKLANEEKQTKEAFQKLELEEKRTRIAYEKLADEQARTKAAYDAEERQRRLAERDFAQAQRAIELVVQFSEGELGHHPGQQDIRRRLLLTALDYYEDFLAEHADDPALQAGRERVELLVTELSTLGGNALMSIMRESRVQRDLNLSDDQKARIIAYIDEQTKPPSFRDRARPMEPPAAVEKALREVLDSAQNERLSQILLQVQNQGKYGFSEPTLVKTLKLTTAQRAEIRQIQNDAHKAWAEHVFSPKKISRPTEFWADVDNRILMVLDNEQQQEWRKMAGASVAVDFREGYPFDGRNIDAQRPRPAFEFFDPARAPIAVQSGDDRAGSGFGHKVFVNDKQYYSWRGKEIEKTAFEIAVTADPLTREERARLLTKEDRSPPAMGDSNEWTVLFRSAEPSLWNTDSPDPANFAIPVAKAPDTIRYLRLKRMDTGEIEILSISHADLTRTQSTEPDQDFAWNGAANEAHKARHLGIVEARPIHGKRFPGQPNRGPGGRQR